MNFEFRISNFGFSPTHPDSPWENEWKIRIPKSKIRNRVPTR